MWGKENTGCLSMIGIVMSPQPSPAMICVNNVKFASKHANEDTRKDIHKMTIANFKLMPHWTDEKWQSMRKDWQEGNFKPMRRRR